MYCCAGALVLGGMGWGGGALVMYLPGGALGKTWNADKCLRSVIHVFELIPPVKRDRSYGFLTLLVYQRLETRSKTKTFRGLLLGGLRQRVTGKETF